MTAREYVVETPEKILLRYVKASIGPRAAAWLIDAAFQGVILGAGLIVAGLLSDGEGGSSRADMSLGTGLAAAFYTILLFLLKWGYYVFFESVMRGATPGKRAMGIRAVRADGEPIDFESVVVRNLVRVVDDFPGLPLVGFLLAISTKRGQRLGDIAAGTIVVLSGSRGMPRMPEEAPRPAEASRGYGSGIAAGGSAKPAPGKRRLDEGELGILRRYLTEAPRLPESVARNLGERLASETEERTGIKREGRDPAEYLASVHAAHGEVGYGDADGREEPGDDR